MLIETPNGVLLNIKVLPKSSFDAVVGIEGDKLKLKVKKPADKGLANEAVIELLSEFFSIPKSNITLVKGAQSRHKTVLFSTVSKEFLEKQIVSLLERK